MGKKTWYVSKEFSLAVAMGDGGVLLHMQIYSGVVNTREIPVIVDVLKSELPSVLETQCFNDEHLSFSQEVKATEMGHLFEHILLEYICLLKIERGDDEVVHSGRTSWNWRDNPQGSFSIFIDISKKDKDVFLKALARSILLMRLVWNMGNRNRLPMFVTD